ncbi:MAG: mucoidy inhibitor MuiA family protein [Candidatus Saccharicenans sp.]
MKLRRPWPIIQEIIWLAVILVLSLSGIRLLAQVPVNNPADGHQAKIVGNEISGEIRLKSQISSVIIYPGRAQVFREAQAALSPETRSVIFPGLPASLIPDSVRVSGNGSARVKILGVEVRTEYLEAEQLPEVKKLMEAIKEIEAEINQIKGQQAILDSQEKFLESVGQALSHQVASNLVAGRLDQLTVDRFLDYFSSKLQAIQKSFQGNDNLLKEKKAKLEALNNKLKDIMPGRSKEEKAVRVLVEVNQPGQLTMSLNYAVSPAGWSPVYTIKALPESNEIELTVAAKVTQKTGENWENARLILSTSSPTAGHQPGQLSPWYLDFYRPRQVMKSMVVEEQAAREMEAAEAPAAAPVYEEKAQVAELWSGINFEVKNLWTILSDGTERRLPIDSQKLPASFDYLSIPKLQELVFLRAGFKNTMSFPLLPGLTDLFIGQDFVGSMNLDFVGSGEEFKLFFGEDNEIKVKRELVKKEKSGPGFLGKTQKVNLSYKITLENLRHRPVEVELVDQIPVSQNAKIEIKDIKINPSPEKQEKNGIITWKIKLDPGKKQEFILSFSVEYPEGTQVVGL